MREQTGACVEETTTKALEQYRARPPVDEKLAAERAAAGEQRSAAKAEKAAAKKAERKASDEAAATDAAAKAAAAAPKSKAELKAARDAKPMSGKNQYIVRHGSGWGVRGEGNSRLTAHCDTQAEAINIGRDIAMNQEAELRIQGRNGQFRESWSYGNDPFPPKG